MISDRIAALIARNLAGEATAEELQELNDFMRQNPPEQYFKDLLHSYWNSQQENSAEQNSSPDQHFQHILQLAAERQPDSTQVIEIYEGLVRRQKRKTWIKRLTIAAIISGILIGGWQFVPKNHETTGVRKDKAHEVLTEKGVRGTKLVLPDGSQVWLNSASRLLYDRTFNDTIREVELEGEAYFDVVKNSKRPFIVHTSGIDIRVLGTAFNVKSYAAEPTIETTLVHGMIEIVRKNQPGAPIIILHPHEKNVFDKTAAIVPDKPESIVGHADTVTKLPKNIADTSIMETSWVYNKLKFEDERFDKVALRLERWFNVRIRFNNDEMGHERVTGSFTTETIDEALHALRLTVPFSYTKNGDEIEIDKKRN